MLNDLVRMGVIQLIVQMLFSVVNPTENPFFSTLFLQTIGFVMIGVLVYWLIVRSVFSFQSTHSGSLPPSGLPYVETFIPNKENDINTMHDGKHKHTHSDSHKQTDHSHKHTDHSHKQTDHSHEHTDHSNKHSNEHTDHSNKHSNEHPFEDEFFPGEE